MDPISRVLPKIHIKQTLRGFYSKTMVSYYFFCHGTYSLHIKDGEHVNFFRFKYDISTL